MPIAWPSFLVTAALLAQFVVIIAATASEAAGWSHADKSVTASEQFPLCTLTGAA